MKKWLVFILWSSFVYGQIQEPVIWETSVISDTIKNIYTIRLKANIEKNWHLYSQFSDPNGAIPTEFKFKKNKKYRLIGKVNETESTVAYDEVFEMDLSYFTQKAIFTQKIEIFDTNLNKIEAEVNYQACDDKLCIFRNENFYITLDGSNFFNNQTIDKRSKDLSSSLKLNLKNTSFINKTQNEEGIYSYFNVFILGFIGGLLALLTPCVFPMIPLTVSFFSSKGSSGKFLSVMYGLFIVFIYLSLSLPFYFIENINPQIFNQISTSPILNFLFFLVFILFALSLFGLFEITLPSSWTNKIDNASNISTGMISTFFMALTLCLVSFSCTGPILGSLLVGSITSQSGALDLTFGMLGFGVSLALPFTFLAISPNSLKVLPKSGIWLSRVKVILGFIELALAFKFLSNADLILELGLLKREVFIIIWILISLSCLIYLINSLRFKRSLILYLLIAFFSYSTINLSLGVKEKSSYKLALLSGLLPPTFYTVYENNNGCPLGLNCFKDFEKGLLESRYTNKPMLIDFTGWACANCRRVEENTWSKNDIYNMINDEFILISLYVDDRSKLLNNKNINLTDKNGNVKILENEGEKWSAFQTLNFNINSQPYYVLVSPSLDILNSPIQYTDTQTYRDWLKEGLDNFKDNN